MLALLAQLLEFRQTDPIRGSDFVTENNQSLTAEVVSN
jgi:hypothetical protein